MKNPFSPKQQEQKKWPIKVFVLERRKYGFEIDDKERGRRFVDDNGNEYLELKLRKVRLPPHQYGDIIRTRDGELAIFVYAHGPEEIYPVDMYHRAENTDTDLITGETESAIQFVPVKLEYGKDIKTGEIKALDLIPRIDHKIRQWFAAQIKENARKYPLEDQPAWINAMPFITVIIIGVAMAAAYWFVGQNLAAKIAINNDLTKQLIELLKIFKVKQVGG